MDAGEVKGKVFLLRCFVFLDRHLTYSKDECNDTSHMEEIGLNHKSKRNPNDITKTNKQHTFNLLTFGLILTFTNLLKGNQRTVNGEKFWKTFRRRYVISNQHNDMKI